MLNLLGLVAFILIAGVSAQATPIVGGFTISYTNHATVVPVRLNGTQTFNFANPQAVALDFTNTKNANNIYQSTPGVAGDFVVSTATGDFSTFLGSLGKIMDFAWTGNGNANYVNPNHGAL